MAKKKKKPSLNSNFPNNATGRRNYKNKKENEQNDKFLNSSFEKLVDLFPSISPSDLLKILGVYHSIDLVVEYILTFEEPKVSRKVEEIKESKQELIEPNNEKENKNCNENQEIVKSKLSSSDEYIPIFLNQQQLELNKSYTLASIKNFLTNIKESSSYGKENWHRHIVDRFLIRDVPNQIVITQRTRYGKMDKYTNSHRKFSHQGYLKILRGYDRDKKNDSLSRCW